MSVFLSRQSRAIDHHLNLRRGYGGLFNLWREFQCSSRVGKGISGNFWSFIKHVKDPFEFQGKSGRSLEMLQRKRFSSHVQGRFRNLRGVVEGH